MNKREVRNNIYRILLIAMAAIIFHSALTSGAYAFTQRTVTPDPQSYISLFKALNNDLSSSVLPHVEPSAVSVFYAWTRAMEIVHEVYPDDDVQYVIPYNKLNAGAVISLGVSPSTWWADNKQMNAVGMFGVTGKGFLASADSPVPGSFAVWGANDANPNGFAAVVEAVENDLIQTSEAIWRPNASKPHFIFSSRSMTIDELKNRTDVGVFQGFIYFLDPVNGVEANIKKILNMNFRHSFVAEGGTATLLITTTDDVTSISMDSPFGHVNTVRRADSIANEDGTRTWHLRWYDAHRNGYGDGTLWTFSVTAYVGNVAAQREDGITVKVIVGK